MTAQQDPDGFLARWSRRKRAVEDDPPAEPAPAEPPLPVAAGPAPQACPVPGLPEIDLASLPKLEDLTSASDVTQFLRPGIPAALRSAALRRMWSLDPAIRDFIGPADYAWDYNDPAGMPGGFGLDIGSKVQQLLAQAIGTPEEARPEAAPEAMPVAELPATAPAEPVLLAQADPPADAGPELPPEPGLPPRRHGGALPV